MDPGSTSEQLVGIKDNILSQLNKLQSYYNNLRYYISQSHLFSSLKNIHNPKLLLNISRNLIIEKLNALSEKKDAEKDINTLQTFFHIIKLCKGNSVTSSEYSDTNLIEDLPPWIRKFFMLAVHLANSHLIKYNEDIKQFIKDDVSINENHILNFQTLFLKIFNNDWAISSLFKSHSRHTYRELEHWLNQLEELYFQSEIQMFKYYPSEQTVNILPKPIAQQDYMPIRFSARISTAIPRLSMQAAGIPKPIAASNANSNSFAPPPSMPPVQHLAGSGPKASPILPPSQLISQIPPPLPGAIPQPIPPRGKEIEAQQAEDKSLELLNHYIKIRFNLTVITTKLSNAWELINQLYQIFTTEEAKQFSQWVRPISKNQEIDSLEMLKFQFDQLMDNYNEHRINITYPEAEHIVNCYHQFLVDAANLILETCKAINICVSQTRKMSLSTTQAW